MSAYHLAEILAPTQERTDERAARCRRRGPDEWLAGHLL